MAARAHFQQELDRYRLQQLDIGRVNLQNVLSNIITIFGPGGGWDRLNSEVQRVTNVQHYWYEYGKLRKELMNVWVKHYKRGIHSMPFWLTASLYDMLEDEFPSHRIQLLRKYANTTLVKH